MPFLSKRFRTVVFDYRDPAGAASRRTDTRWSNSPGIASTYWGILAYPVAMRWVSLSADRTGDGYHAAGSGGNAHHRRFGWGARTLSGGPRNVSADTEREIRDVGFERYIRAYIENDTMAFNSKFYREHGDVVLALANAVWSGQSTVELFRRHEDARLTWDTLAKGAEVRVRSLILCGADDNGAVADHPGGNRKASRRGDARLRTISDSEREAYDVLGRDRWAYRTARLFASASDRDESLTSYLKPRFHLTSFLGKINRPIF